MSVMTKRGERSVPGGRTPRPPIQAPDPRAAEGSRERVAGPSLPGPGKPTGPEDRRFWPADKPLPTVYARPPIPCERCRRVLADDMGRAVIVVSRPAGLAWLRCRCCRHRWKLPVG